MDLVGLKEVKWDGSGTLELGNYALFYGAVNSNHQLETEFFILRRIRSAVKRLKIISGRVSCITLKDLM